MKNTTRAMMFVAHPDDCIIFGWPLIRKYKHFDWKIIYMTYSLNTKRGKEIANFWQHYGVPVDFCGVEDHYRDLEAGKIITFNVLEAKQIVQDKVHDIDILLTHGVDGEYGHPHHKFVHECLKDLPVNKLFFGGEKPDMFIEHQEYSNETQNLNLVPEHRNIIESFPDRYKGNYNCTKETKSIIDLL